MTPPTITDPLRVADCAGLWQRTLLAVAGETLDATADVRWLQGITAFVDLRRQARRPDFTGTRCADDLTTVQRAWLTTQDGFAGHLTDHDSIFQWDRFMGLQPPGPHPDAGHMSWDGDTLVEVGVHADYLEHWSRPSDTDPECWAVDLISATGNRALLLRVGDRFGWARTGPEEISLGVIGRHWRITDSSLPFREGHDLSPHLRATTLDTADITPSGQSITCLWTVLDSEGLVKL